MSQQLISRSQDLKKLRDEGYDLEIKFNHLLTKSVPYVNSNKEIRYGTLVSALDIAGDITATPNTHLVYFIGDHPCNQDGTELTKIKHQSENKALDQDLIVNHSFSSKPVGGRYKDYYDKM